MAKDLARRSGMTLGEWLNQMIVDGNDPATIAAEALSQAGHTEPEPAPADLARADALRRPRLQAGAESDRVGRSLEALAVRLEAAERRSTLAISGIDQSVMGILARVEGVEHDQAAVVDKVGAALDEMREGNQRISEQLKRIADEEEPRADAMRGLEGALAKVASQLYDSDARHRAGVAALREDLGVIGERVDHVDLRLSQEPTEIPSAILERLAEAEGRTTTALKQLENSFAGLDARLERAERSAAPVADAATRRFERLATELGEQVEAGRAEMAERMRAAADAKLDRMEAALTALSANVDQSERRAAQAIEKMGHEVMRIAQTIGARVEQVETRSNQALEQVGGDVARIAASVETRLTSADEAQSTALERLGGEIGRIADKLAERIAAAERRSAEALDDVGERVEKASHRIDERQEQVSAEFAEKIRASEERTAQMLEDARTRLEQRLSEVQRPFTPSAAAFAPAPQDAAAPVAEAFEPPPLIIEPAAVSADEALFAADPFDDPFEPAAPQPVAEPEPALELAPAPKPEPVLAAEPAFARTFDADPAPAAVADESAYAPAAPRHPNRDLIEAARAAARQAAATEGRQRRAPRPEPEAEAAAPARKGFGLSLGLKKRKDSGPTLRTALLASGTAATLSMAVAGYGLLASSRDEAPPAAVASADAVLTGSPAAAAPASDVTTTEPASSAAAPTLAVAMTPASGRLSAPFAAEPIVPTPETDATSAAPRDQARTLYAEAVRQIEAGDTSGMEPLRRAANLGDPAAQFYLAKLYEGAGAGLKKDMAEARRWTERAAVAGDPKAMHNLGLYFFEGAGGEKNLSRAAAWFRRAADLGLQDSQFNLARLYEEGYGVPKNAAEAYKWYLVAGAGGDTESRSGAERVRGMLSAEAQQTAQRTAGAYRAQLARRP